MAVNNLPQLWKFDPGDYLSLGATFTKFLSNLNIYTQAIYTILNGNVGFANLQRAIYSTTITAGSTTPMKFVNPAVEIFQQFYPVLPYWIFYRKA